MRQEVNVLIFFNTCSKRAILKKNKKNQVRLFSCFLFGFICLSFNVRYLNTIVGSSPGEQIFIYFEKNKVRLSKIEFFNFCF